MDYCIIDGSEHLNIDEVVNLLKKTYWADKREYSGQFSIASPAIGNHHSG